MSEATRARRAATVVAAFAGLCLLTDAVLLLAFHPWHGYRASSFANAAMAVAWPLLAILILRRQPTNRLAWLFLLLGVLIAVYLPMGDLARHLHETHHERGATWLLWIGFEASDVGWPLLWVIMQIFPDGRPLPGRWWRTLCGVSLLWMGLGFTSSIGGGGPVGDGWHPQAPVGWPQLNHVIAAGGVVTTAGFWVLIFGGGVASLVVRYRRAQGQQRQQLKLFAVVMVLTPAFIGTTSLPSLLGLGVVLLPAAYGVAILRYGLYDIDRLISRTVSWALLTGLLVGIYLGLVAGVTALLPARSSLAVAAATLVVAALFQPLRRWLQTGVDRRFNRAHYDAQRQVEHFSTRLREHVAVDAVLHDLVGVVHATVQPTQATVWVPPQPLFPQPARG